MSDEKATGVTMPDLHAEFTAVPHISRRLRAMDAGINDRLALFKANPDQSEDFLDELIDVIDLADELRHELTDNSPRMPPEQYDFMKAMVQCGRLVWFEDSDEGGGEEHRE